MKFDFQERTNLLTKRLRFLGSWFKNGVISFDLYLVYAVIFNIYYNFHNVVQAVYLVNHFTDLSELTSSGLLTLTEILTNFKAYCLIKNRTKILKLNDRVNMQMFQPKNSYQEESAKSTFKVFDVMYLMHALGPTLTVLFFGLYPVIDVKTKIKRLPFNAWYPYDYKASPFFELTYFHQLSGSLVQAHIHINIDCLAVNFIAILIIQLDMLADNLRNITALKKCEKSEKTERALDEALFSCMKHHKEILLCFEDVYQIVNILMLGQYLMSTTALCLTSLEMSTVSPTSTHFAALLVYELALVTELLIFCWWGNELIYKSQLLPQAAFESDWVEGSISFKKNLAFFIFCTQKEMALYAVDFFKISLGSFLLIIKNSYSFYAVLRHVKNDGLEN